jgi:hypothetical protein
MSRGPDLLVTMSAVKRTFATHKSECVMDSGTESELDESDLVNPGMICSLMSQTHGVWKEGQPNGRL